MQQAKTGQEEAHDPALADGAAEEISTRQGTCSTATSPEATRVEVRDSKDHQRLSSQVGRLEAGAELKNEAEITATTVRGQLASKRTTTITTAVLAAGEDATRDAAQVQHNQSIASEAEAWQAPRGEDVAAQREREAEASGRQTAAQQILAGEAKEGAVAQDSLESDGSFHARAAAKNEDGSELHPLSVAEAGQPLADRDRVLKNVHAATHSAMPKALGDSSLAEQMQARDADSAAAQQALEEKAGSGDVRAAEKVKNRSGLQRFSVTPAGQEERVDPLHAPPEKKGSDLQTSSFTEAGQLFKDKEPLEDEVPQQTQAGNIEINPAEQDLDVKLDPSQTSRAINESDVKDFQASKAGQEDQQEGMPGRAGLSPEDVDSTLPQRHQEARFLCNIWCRMY